MNAKIMKKRWMAWTSLVAVCVILLLAVPFNASAGSVITSVNIRVILRVSPGDTLPSSIDTSENLKNGDFGCSVTTTSGKYYIEDVEWVTSENAEMHVGDTAKMKVTLYPQDPDAHYFRGSYSSSNVSIKGGSYVSHKRSGDKLIITLKTDPMDGDYDSPEDAYWRDSSGLGNARWVEPESTSGYYDVYLYHGSSTLKKLEAYKGTSYNFYPYMTKKGTYRFKVRTVPRPDSSDSGKRSDWIESDEIYISQEDVSDGSGQTNGNYNNTSVGWQKQGDTWYYRYPDGSYQKDSWLKVNDRWYLFNSQGQMLTGWQTRNGQTYVLLPSGEMVTGWFLSDGKWHFLNQTPGDLEGALYKNSWIHYNGKIYYVDGNGVMVERWFQVDGNWYYFYPGDGSKAVNTVIDGFPVDADGVWRR